MVRTAWLCRGVAFGRRSTNRATGHLPWNAGVGRIGAFTLNARKLEYAWGMFRAERARLQLSGCGISAYGVVEGLRRP